MRRQLKIWRDDFLRYYDKTSLMARIFIGAVLSLALAYYWTKTFIVPQNAAVKAIIAKVNSQGSTSDADITISDLKNKQRKAKNQLDGAKKVNSELMEVFGSMNRDDTGKSILEIRSILDKYDIKIVSESRTKEVVAVKSRRRSRNAKAPTVSYKMTLPLPNSMGRDSYDFVILGSFASLKNFMLEAHKSPALMFLNNIKIERSNELITDKDFNQYQALKCTFQAHIPYKKAGK